MERITRPVKNFGHSTFSSLKVRNYRLYFIGQGISLSGTWMQTVAQAWLVLELTGSGTALGLVIAFQFLPILLFGPMGGVIADRVSKRKLLFITQASAATLALILASLIATGLIALWMVYVLAACLGMVNALDNPTRQTFVFEMVGHKDLSNAVTLNSTEVSLARVIGPAIAGIVIAKIGIAPCFFLNAASYIAVLVCLWLMRSSELHRRQPAARARGQLRQGLWYIWHTPILRDLLIMLGIVGTFTYEFQVSLALIAKYTFSGDARAFALLTSAFGAGSVIGGLAIAGRRRTNPRGLIWILMVFGITMALAAFAPSLAWAAGAMVLVGISSICFTSLGNTILQLETAPEMRSRVMALWSVAFLGSTPIGGPIVGWIGEHIDPRWGLGIGAIATFAAAIIGILLLKSHPALHTRRDLLPLISDK